LAAVLKDQFGAEVDLIEGEKGIFDVAVDGELVFSKHAAGRFPEEKEIVDKLERHGTS
jgi:selT/selW/selH-like putative selenoprotein